MSEKASEKSAMPVEDKKLIYEYLKKCGAESLYERVFDEGDEDAFLQFAKTNQPNDLCSIHQYLTST